MHRPLWLLLFVPLAIGCGDGSSITTIDAAMRDTAPSDTATSDAPTSEGDAAVDAPSPDGGPLDSGARDAGADAGDRCANGERDGDETDIDCGGSCEGCAVDATCTTGSDCMTGACLSGTCRRNAWERAADLPIARSHYAAALGTDGRVYVFGGEIRGVPQAHVHVYNPVLDAWAALSPMPTARAAVSAVQATNGRFYVVGGETRRDAFGYTDGTTRVVESFDPVAGTWRTEPSLPEGHGYGGAAFHGGRVLVFGGIGGGPLEAGSPGAPSPNTLALDESTGAWSAVSGRLSQDQRSFGVATIAGVGVLAVGGWRTHFSDYDLLAATDLYDGSAWYTRAPMPETREGPSAASIDGVAYVFGGLTNTGVTRIMPTVRAYVPADDAWVGLGSMPTPSYFGGAVALDAERILVIGGLAGDTPRVPTTEVWIYTP